MCVCVCVKMEKIEQERMVKLPKKDGNWGQLFDFLSITLKITTDGNCSHEIKRYLLLGRKAGFSSSHYECESCHKES